MILKYIESTNKYHSIREVIKNEFHISARLITLLRKDKRFLLNGISTYIDKELQINDILTINLDFDEDNSNIVSTKMNLNILYEDDCYLVIDKPAGIAIHPSCSHYDTSLSNGIKYYFDLINLKRKIRPVNRLDKDTSGLVIFAKNQYIHECLVKQMANGTFYKEYVAILEGYLKKKAGIINASIARKPGSIIEREISANGEKAITEYTVLKESNNISLVRFVLKTGRTHQIRVHSKYIGHPIVGDTLYGTKSSFINRQALHSCKIEFIHPIFNTKMTYISPLLDEFNLLLS